jgi:4-hydroxybenzoate polyprenyl transferase
MAINFSILF